MRSTVYFGSTAVNQGPLTTTFTTPSACATQSDFRYLTYIDSKNSSLHRFMGSEICGTKTLGSCYPSGGSVDKIRNTLTKQWWYFSPGVACPMGWTTAGALEGGPEPTGSGVFSGDLNPSGLRRLAIGEYFASILDENEILALCCPSGWTGGIYGSCSSSLGPVTSYSISQRCMLFSQEGDNEDRLVLITMSGSTTRISDIYETKTQKDYWATANLTGVNHYMQIMPTAPIEDITVATITPGVRLVYKQTDLEGAAKTGGGTNKDIEGASARLSFGFIGFTSLVTLGFIMNM